MGVTVITMCQGQGSQSHLPVIAWGSMLPSLFPSLSHHTLWEFGGISHLMVTRGVCSPSARSQAFLSWASGSPEGSQTGSSSRFF